jgi:hypothetical protein
MNTPPPATLSPLDLIVLREKRTAAEIAARDLRIAELEVFVRYELTMSDSFDLATGLITRSAPPATTEG